MNEFDSAQRRVLTLKPGRERVVANRHPWIFGGAVGRESGPEDAAIADLVDGRGALLASGFHSLHSQIRLRALTRPAVVELVPRDAVRGVMVDSGSARGGDEVTGWRVPHLAQYTSPVPTWFPHWLQ